LDADETAASKVRLRVKKDHGTLMNYVTRRLLCTVTTGPPGPDGEDVMALVYDPLYVPLDSLPLLYPDDREPSDKSQDSGIKSEMAQVDDESWDNEFDSVENEIDDGDDEG